MSIGTNIYELRKNKKLTQMELAQKIGVTEQSVSKWENDICSPDVSMFPQLAKLFNVSIDRIYGFHLNSYEEEVNNLISQCENLNPYEQIEYLENALKQYPNSDKLKRTLAWNYFMKYRIDNSDKERNEAAVKAIDLYNEIIANNFDQQTNDEINNRLVDIYSETGDFDKAIAAVEKISAENISFRIIGKSIIYNLSNNLSELQKHVEKSLYECFLSMDLANYFYCISLDKNGRYDDAIRHYDLQDRILSLFDAGGDDFYVSHRINNALNRASSYKKQNKKEECFKELKRFTDLILKADKVASADHSIQARNIFFKTSTEMEAYIENPREFGLSILKRLTGFFENDDELEELIKVLSNQQQ